MSDLERVQSIDRAVSILKCFTENKRELKLSEIAEQLGLNKSTVHGILSTLKYHRLISQDEKTQKYRLGLYLIELGEHVICSMDVRSIAYPIIEEICKELEETVHVVILDGIEVVYIDKKECDKSIKISTKIGARNLAYSTADGKVMLAYLDLETQMKMIPENIEKLTPNTIINKQMVIKELAEIKKRGYAFDYEENIVGLICVAAPVFDYSGQAKYGISVMGPTIRMTEEKISQTINVLKNATNRISYLYGFRE